ncbi:VOC family protein [Streptomyces sp. NPDC048057]|uniref:VOC family protein n=1 Tax=Streptomyces sp. NPDC048057 TaxID=3155628 RepID=UPI00340907C5
MLRGVANVRYHTSDLEAAKRWYTELLGIEPYFNRPEYAEFRIGDYSHELGLLDNRYIGMLGGHTSTDDGPGGVVAYWHVDDVQQTFKRLLSMGATKLEEPRDFGEGFIGATVVDPFGNVLGIMDNPHYVDVLSAQGTD